MTSHVHGRRLAASGFALIAAGALVAGCTGSSDDVTSDGGIGGSVIWADFGGPTNESRQVAYFDGFAEEHGVEVTSVPIEDAVSYPMLEGEDGDYDVFQVSAAEPLNYAGGARELPEAARSDLLPDELSPYLMGGFYLGMAQGWLTETFPDGGPQDWADFFDTQKYPGKRAWPGQPPFYDSSYEIALLADGVAPEDLYPLDLERAIAKLDTIRDDLVFYQSYAEVQQLLASGSTAIAVTVTGQFTALSNAGQDVTVQWNQAFTTPQGFVVPAESSNPDAVLALAEWMNDPEHQAVFVERTGYGPVNSEVFDHLDPEFAATLANSPEHEDVVIPWNEQWRADNKQAMLDAYTEWLAG
ncbi:extracellular solute-binding protein [Jiangella endophytica]|uniref:extracellular solute-binding protein n=1 Tax=Jiangella endophytica TaxID=1623398 RepID=UPI000E34C05F|nr:extracellular solute-binding protein [Jiangella endophytica]